MKAPPSPPRITPAPDFKEAGLKPYFDTLNNDVRRELMARSVRTEPVDSILLISPNKTVYKITVSDTGVLSTEAMPS